MNSSEQVISISQKLLPIRHRTNTKDRHPCLQWDSNPQIQHPSGFKPIP